MRFDKTRIFNVVMDRIVQMSNRTKLKIGINRTELNTQQFGLKIQPNKSKIKLGGQTLFQVATGTSATPLIPPIQRTGLVRKRKTPRNKTTH